ncbi:hypothetical protein GMLC_41460 [Geomonas limicola]|uniref:Uncharacterized protein n=1 Tax=Geomonas limicola TaxID=2740186 RepID=A0A6V8NFJ8_9BACT|nr:hypothetical protein [Geomonas limicola]GFO70567.1 hypothetical protein GMLC_41460 [Geomonas limicola]
MEELKFKSTGTDAAYLGNANIFFTILYALSIFQHDWREDKLGSQGFLEKALEWFRQMFAGGQLHLASRKEARKALNAIIQKILYYIAIFADESDIQMLLNSGVVTKKPRKRTRKSVKHVPAPGNSTLRSQRSHL